MTHRRISTILLLSLLTCSNAWCANAKGLLLTQTAFDSDRYIARIAIINSSSWDIDAFGLTIDVIYSDGMNSRTERLVDLQPQLDSQSASGQVLTPFRPGEVRYETFSVDRHDGTTVDRIDVTVDMIVSGKKGNATNKPALHELVRARTARADADDLAAQIILKNLKDFDTSEAIPRSIQELENVLKVQAEKNSRQYLEVAILHVVSELESLQSRTADQRVDLLKLMIDKGQQRARAFREHAQVKEER